MTQSIRRLIALTLALAMMVVTGAMPAAAVNAAPCAAMSMPMTASAMSSDHRKLAGNHAMMGVGCGDCCIVVPPLVVSVEPAAPVKAVPRLAIMSVAMGWAIAPPFPPPRG